MKDERGIFPSYKKTICYTVHMLRYSNISLRTLTVCSDLENVPQDRPEGAGQRHYLGHGGDAGPPRHPHGEQGGQ